jgi:hypothetical protein
VSLYSLTSSTEAEYGVHRPKRLRIRQVRDGDEKLVAIIEEHDDETVTVQIAPGVRVETMTLATLMDGSDMSLRPRPGESAEDVLDRVTRAAREQLAR